MCKDDHNGIHNSSACREIIQNKMREKFSEGNGMPDETMFVYEVTQYEISGENGRKYIVYLDNDLCVDYRENGRWPDEGQAETYHKLKLLENLPDNHFNYNQKLSFRRQLAEALVARYDGKPYIANTLLDTAKTFYDECLYRWIFLRLCGIMTAYMILIIYHVLAFNFHANITQWLFTDLDEISAVILGSTLGAYLSFVTRGWKKYSGLLMTKSEIFLTPLLRLIYGVITSCIALKIVTIKLICPEIITGILNQPYGQIVLALLVGYCDFLVPTWLDSFAKRCDDTLETIFLDVASIKDSHKNC